MSTRGEILKSRWDAKLLTPNFLSIARLLLLPLGLLYVYKSRTLLTLLVFGIIALTDALDGLLARRWRCTSKVGKALDHVVDKVVFLAVTYALYLWRDFPLGAFIFLLLREVATVSVGGYLFLKGQRLEPNIVGRLSGFFFSLVLLSYFLRWHFRELILWISIGLLTVASLNYMRLYVIKLTGVVNEKSALTINTDDPEEKNDSSDI